MPQGEQCVAASTEEFLIHAAHNIADAGYDFAEVTAGYLMKLTEQELFHMEDLHRRGMFSIEACNSFLPPVLSIWDSEKESALYEYIDKLLCACSVLDIHVMVFGSGAARRMPQGMTIREGHRRIVEFLEKCHPFAEKYGVTIAVEPLNRDECNILNTVSESAEVVRAAHLPYVRLLADAYHVYRENEDLSVLADNSDILTHIHIAEPPARVYAGRDGGVYLRKFAEALKKANYSGRVSMECGFQNFEEELRMAVPFVKEVFQ